MLIDIGTLTVMGIGLGAALGAASRLLAVEENPIEEELRALLPGSQCGQCGFVGCGQAAAALARGEAPVTLCPPGGKAVAEQLAKKLGVTADLSGHEEAEPRYAVVIEEKCIGCMKCARQCSVDAFVGAAKQIHTAIAEVCHGCAKCVEICPTWAIEMVPVPKSIGSWHWPKPEPVHALGGAPA